MKKEGGRQRSEVVLGHRICPEKKVLRAVSARKEIVSSSPGVAPSVRGSGTGQRELRAGEASSDCVTAGERGKVQNCVRYRLLVFFP